MKRVEMNSEALPLPRATGVGKEGTAAAVAAAANEDDDWEEGEEAREEEEEEPLSTWTATEE